MFCEMFLVDITQGSSKPDPRMLAVFPKSRSLPNRKVACSWMAFLQANWLGDRNGSLLWMDYV